MKVLIEEKKDDYFIGHTSNYIKVRLKGNFEINEEYDVLLDENNIIFK